MGHPPQKSGPTAGATVELEDLRAAYLKLMDWDPVTTMPNQARLEKLGLDELVKVRY
jgi:aldehyde:ferredoxin oxidoreductase